MRELNAADLDEIVRVHGAAFPESILTLFGPEAVKRYYAWQLSGPHDIAFLGLFMDGRLAAFCLGGIFQGAMKGFVRKNRAWLAAKLFSSPSLWTQRRFWRKAAAIRGMFRFCPRGAKAAPAPVPCDSFGISAIAVDPARRREGLGRKLMDASQEIALARGFLKMDLSVNPSNRGAISFYESLGWKKTGDGTDWNGCMIKNLEKEIA
ncbi:MAG TPA: GNAT family N-acetyltransferase [Verrucomicrobiae bacterium]|nr:GNAT family N-acetyltransferase [Verrucomicrobiae bacterium]